MWLTRRKARDLLRRVLHTHDTPERTALAFALGVGLAFSPFFGLHYLFGVVAAFAFGLNRVAVIAGVSTNNPYTFLPILAICMQTGSLLTGRGWLAVKLPDRSHFDSIPQFWAWVGDLKPLLLPFFAGTLTLSVLSFIVAYGVTLPLIKRVRRLRQSETPGD